MVTITLTKRELNLLADSVMHNWKDVSDAKKLVYADETCRNAIEAYYYELLKLHEHLCCAMEDEED